MHVWPEQIFRPIGVLNRFTELRNSKVEFKFIFLQGVKPAVAVVMLKLPSISVEGAAKARRLGREEATRHHVTKHSGRVAGDTGD